MADVRFLILVGPPSLDPSRMGFPPAESPSSLDVTPATAAPAAGRDRRAGVRRRPGTASEFTGWYAWRLMASNNRRLARSLSSFSTRPFAVDAITRLRTQLDDLQPAVSTDPRNGSWGWRAELAGVPVAICPHWYERERDCRTGFRRFVEAAHRAQVADGGTVLRGARAPVLTTFDVERPRRWPDN
jgi:hypothetical protein